MPKITGNTESYREGLLESLRNPEDAAHYLNACLEDEDPARIRRLRGAGLRRQHRRGPLPGAGDRPDGRAALSVATAHRLCGVRRGLGQRGRAGESNQFRPCAGGESRSRNEDRCLPIPERNGQGESGRNARFPGIGDSRTSACDRHPEHSAPGAGGSVGRGSARAAAARRSSDGRGSASRLPRVSEAMRQR